MKTARSVLLIYSLLLSVFIGIGAGRDAILSQNPLFFLLFTPVVIHFIITLFKPGRSPKVLIYYGFILTTVMTLTGLIKAESLPQTISAVLFAPIALHFWLLVLPKNFKSKIEEQKTPEPESKPKPVEMSLVTTSKPKTFDADRRTFLKLLGSVSLTVFLLSLFSRRFEDSLFGSKPQVQNSPTVESTKEPTEGYKITEIDDNTPSYFGFINSIGNWYITEESETGSFRYAKGNKNFASNWRKRSSLKYDYFDKVFK